MNKPPRAIPNSIVTLVVVCSVFTVMQVVAIGNRQRFESTRVDALYTALTLEQATKSAKGEKLASPPADAIARNPDVVPEVKQAPDNTTTGTPTPVVALGPTGAQVADAVVTYLAAHPPPAGKNGTSPDPAKVAAQITSAVRAHLLANPPAAGRDGTDGAASTVPGPDGAPGPGPTDAQVIGAVTTYCDANGSCRGTAGTNGVAGTAGTPGQPPLSWTVVDANGRSSTCIRDVPFDPAAPTFSCAPTP